jgi:hypothetical protein
MRMHAFGEKRGSAADIRRLLWSCDLRVARERFGDVWMAQPSGGGAIALPRFR